MRFSRKKSTDIRIPVGNSRKRKIQARRDLLAEYFPVGLHIPAPVAGAIPLLPRKSTPRQYHDPLPVGGLSLMLEYTTDMLQRISIQYPPVTPHRSRLIIIPILYIDMIRLGRIHPPRIYSQRP